MKAWTDYPVNGNENQSTIEVEVLSYDRNKYCEVRFNGNTEEVKSGYLFRDFELKKFVGKNLYRLPSKIGEKPPTKHRVQKEIKNHRKTEYCVREELSSNNWRVFSNLHDALVCASTLDYFTVVMLTQTKNSNSSIPIISRDNFSYPYVTVYVDHKMRSVVKTKTLRKLFKVD